MVIEWSNCWGSKHEAGHGQQKAAGVRTLEQAVEFGVRAMPGQCWQPWAWIQAASWPTASVTPVVDGGWKKMHLPWADLHVFLQNSPDVVTSGVSQAPPHPLKPLAPLCCTENSANRIHFLDFLLQRMQKTQKLMVPPSLLLRIS